MFHLYEWTIFRNACVARVVELVDAGDSKSPAARRAGSIPASGTSDRLIDFLSNEEVYFFVWKSWFRVGEILAVIFIGRKAPTTLIKKPADLCIPKWTWAEAWQVEWCTTAKT